MPKAKDTADAERAARRRRLEALREDCGRHLDGCVRIKLVEDGACPSLAVSTRWACGILKDGRKVEMALLGSSREAEDRARALLHRLGEMLDEPPDEDGATSDFARDPDLRAMLVLAMRAKGRTSWTGSKDGLHFPPMPDGEVRPESLETAWRDAGMIRQTEREVPDARAAIADLCAELLEVKPIVKRRRLRDIGKLAWMGLATDFEERNGRRPSGVEMAKILDIHPSNFSRRVGSTKDWKDYQAYGVREPKREPKK